MTLQIGDVHELIQALDIAGVTYYAVTAEREEGESDAPLPTDIAPEFGMRIRTDGAEFGVRLRVEIQSSVGRVVVDAAMEYESEDDLEIPDDVAFVYANEVAVMALLPYVREAVANITQRVFGDALVMPVIPRGALAFKSGKADSDIEAQDEKG